MIRVVVAAMVALMAAWSAIADAANTLITFSTKGPDRYADGMTVLDGERYALVWTANEKFGGFATDGSAAVDGDLVICIASRAKGGRCPATVFQVDSDIAPKGGRYFVYMLDTRVSKIMLSDKVEITGSVSAMQFSAGTGSSNVAKVTADSTVNAVGWSVPLVTGAKGLTAAGEIAAPRITAIRVDGANVIISVDNVRPGLRYSVRGGLDKKTVISLPEFKDGETVDFVVPKDSAGFFSVSAE